MLHFQKGTREPIPTGSSNQTKRWKIHILSTPVSFEQTPILAFVRSFLYLSPLPTHPPQPNDARSTYRDSFIHSISRNATAKPFPEPLSNLNSRTTIRHTHTHTHTHTSLAMWIRYRKFLGPSNGNLVTPGARVSHSLVFGLCMWRCCSDEKPWKQQDATRRPHGVRAREQSKICQAFDRCAVRHFNAYHPTTSLT